ncbi:MAG: hypothetical protein NC311_09095 [Muribaculaceae bacterium]|nr:hypothetical protein [Muribaculaceae bacterium]
MSGSEILNILLGGGLIATLLGLITLKAAVRKANAEAATAQAEAKKAEAEAETAFADAERLRIDNTEHATRVLVENLLQPLTKELNETRKEIGALKREMARLRKAIDSANDCPHSGDCPVIARMREQKADSADRGDSGGNRGKAGHRLPRGQTDHDSDGAGEPGTDEDSGERPP